MQSLALACAAKAANARVARLVKCIVGSGLVLGEVNDSGEASNADNIGVLTSI